jgi:hypothetical protein
MLAFGQLVLQNPDSVDLLTPRLGKPSKQEQDAMVNGDLLVTRFRGFHIAVSEQLQEHLRRDIKAIVFSDSAFVSLYNLPDLLGFARGLMWRLLSKKIPARMGIAQGTFASLRYGSDIAGDAAIHSSQFLGTGVVKAHRAEGSVKGVAICIDESVEPYVAELDPAELVRLIPKQGSASAIANLVFHRTEQTVAHRDKRHKEARRLLTAMKNASDSAFHHYYDFALGKLDPMRDQWVLPN